MDADPCFVGPAPLIAAMCDAVDLVGVIDRLTEWDPGQCRLSPGTRIKALIVNILTARRPLYRVAEAFLESDVELILGAGADVSDLNDDALARALDKLWVAGPKQVYSAVATRAVLVEDVERRSVHWDSTSRSVHGVYNRPDGTLAVTHGYSKDHRPDLRQFLIALLCNREGIPLSADVQDGNQSDKVGNAEAIDDLVAALQPEELLDVLYVADSSLCTGPNLKKMHDVGLRFLTRLPESFKAAGELKQRAWAEDRWVEIGALSPERRAARYRASEHEAEIGGHRYRAVVIASDHLDQRKEKTLQRHLAAEQRRLAKRIAELQAQNFNCEADAEQAAGALLLDEVDGLLPVDAEVVSEQYKLKRPQPGRPPKGELAPQRTVFRVRCRIGEPTAERLEAWRRRENAFVLLTNADGDAFDARALLQEYKFQTAVELRFGFLKDPVYMDAVYVHRRDRLESLIYVLVMACLIFALLERRVRRALAACGQKLVVPGNRPVDNPTGKSLLEMLANTVVVRAGPRQRQLFCSSFARQRTARVVELAGFQLSIYTDVPELPARS